MNRNCRKDGSVNIPLIELNSTSKQYPTSMFLSSFRFTLNKQMLANTKDVVEKGDKVIVGIEVSPNLKLGPFSFVFIEEGIYTAVVTPKLVYVNQINDFNIVLLVNKTSHRTIQWNPLPRHLMSATFLPVVDYCTGGERCSNLSTNYLSEATTYRDKCILNNEFDFVAKYYYCKCK